MCDQFAPSIQVKILFHFSDFFFPHSSMGHACTLLHTKEVEDRSSKKPKEVEDPS